MGHKIAPVRHYFLAKILPLHHEITKDEFMNYWVYIIEVARSVYRIGLTTELSSLLVLLKPAERMVYVRSFRVPFDAAAHKHLLDDLSLPTVRRIINRQKPITNKIIQDITVVKL